MLKTTLLEALRFLIKVTRLPNRRTTYFLTQMLCMYVISLVNRKTISLST